jgi:DNA-binding MarR family transcriptional regulator
MKNSKKNNKSQRIFRTVKDPAETTWTSVDNRVLSDKSLRLSDVGLLALMLSRPDHWAFNASELASRCGDGVTSVRSALRRLEAAGYVRRTRGRGEHGHWRTTVRVFEIPSLNRWWPGVGPTGAV